MSKIATSYRRRLSWPRCLRMTCWAFWPRPIPVPPSEHGRRVVSTRRGLTMNLDSATPIDLDPLRRFDLQATFLHRVRRRARVLAQLRANLQRSAWGRQALEWRLRGFVGVQAVAERLVRDVATANQEADEALLTLADFLIVLREVDYEPAEGALSRTEFYEGLRHIPEGTGPEAWA